MLGALSIVIPNQAKWCTHVEDAPNPRDVGWAAIHLHPKGGVSG